MYKLSSYKLFFNHFNSFNESENLQRFGKTKLFSNIVENIGVFEIYSLLGVQF